MNAQKLEIRSDGALKNNETSLKDELNDFNNISGGDLGSENSENSPKSSQNSSQELRAEVTKRGSLRANVKSFTALTGENILDSSNPVRDTASKSPRGNLDTYNKDESESEHKNDNN